MAFGLFGAVLFILSGAPIDFLVKIAGIAPTSGLGIFWTPILVMAAIGLLFHPGKIIRAAFRAPPVVFMVGAIALSCLWSIDPATSIKNTMFFFASVVGAFYVSQRFSLVEILNVFAVLFGGLAVVSTVLALGLPQIGTMQEIHVGAWNGVWVDKNTMGGFFAMGFGLAVARFAVTPSSWLTSLPLGLISLAMVLMTTSKTALVGLLLILAVAMGVFIMRRGPVIAAMFVWLSTMTIAALVAIMIFAPGILFGLLNRDATLTSRTIIWTATERLIEQRPVKGFGFDAVWGDQSASGPVVAVHQEVHFKPTNAHSSWMDARLETGIPGLATLILMAGFALIAALWSIPRSKSAYWTLPTLVMLLQSSFTESTLVNAHGTESFLFILLTVLAASSGRMKQSPVPQQMAAPVPAPVPFMPAPFPPLPPVPVFVQPPSSARLAERLYRITHPIPQ
ncbi:MAG: hypothetical protein COA47_08540 [Robiginitomaculum sp.]|nr:MAG: hypothetical protein COA47_08540 [Robiginitomaculum sp.]